MSAYVTVILRFSFSWRWHIARLFAKLSSKSCAKWNCSHRLTRIQNNKELGYVCSCMLRLSACVTVIYCVSLPPGREVARLFTKCSSTSYAPSENHSHRLMRIQNKESGYVCACMLRLSAYITIIYSVSLFLQARLFTKWNCAHWLARTQMCTRLQAASAC